tara:strand:+ start:10757 stop:11182 length:426 start_codon:yes stop_codon:yes gene_type:complete
LEEWTFRNEIFDEKDIDKFEGFVYIITNMLDGRRYIGRKYFYNIRKVKGKKRRQRSPSDWKNYYGSSEQLKADIEKYGKKNFKREILSLHTTRGDCNYEEVKQQFLHNVLEEDNFYNDNISGKYHRKPKHIIESRKTILND